VTGAPTAEGFARDPKSGEWSLEFLDPRVCELGVAEVQRLKPLEVIVYRVGLG